MDWYVGGHRSPNRSRIQAIVEEHDKRNSPVSSDWKLRSI